MHPALILILVAVAVVPLAALPSAASADDHPLLVQVYYAAFRDDEFVAVHNPTAAEVNLTAWMITDGEGSVVFPNGSRLAPGVTAIATTNGTVYWKDTLRLPDFSITGMGGATLLVPNRRPQLSNAGDEVLLVDPSGRAVDVFVYGDSSYGGLGWKGNPAALIPQGKVASRRVGPSGYLDTDGPGDWDGERLHGLGQSSWPFGWMEVRGSLTAFLAPDSSYAVLQAALTEARRGIYINAYEWSSADLTDQLILALSRGVKVGVYIEGSPIGGFSPAGLQLLRDLAAHGADVRVMVNATGYPSDRRYRLDHAKYLIIDGSSVVVCTENFSDTGFPVAGRTGNRGWGLVIQNRSLARVMNQYLRQDWNLTRRDVISFTYAHLLPTAPSPGVSTRPYPEAQEPLLLQGSFPVAPLLAPDHTLGSEGMLDLLGSAQQSIDAELFYAVAAWRPGHNPYLEALLAAAHRGVQVRLLLDGSGIVTEGQGTGDNDATVAYLQKMAPGLPLQVKMAGGNHSFLKIHTKGLVIDGRVSVVGSLNWAYPSIVLNREVSLALDNASVARYFTRSFERDWADTPALSVDAGDNVTARVGEAIELRARLLTAREANFTWSVLGTSTRGSGETFIVSFARPGSYRVRVVAVDMAGRRGTDEVTITVVPADPWAGLGRALPLLALGPAPLVAFLLLRRRRKKIRPK